MGARPVTENGIFFGLVFFEGFAQDSSSFFAAVVLLRRVFFPREHLREA